MKDKIKHPAVFSDQFLPIIYELIKDIKVIFDPFAGTGKIALIKGLGFNGLIFCNDLGKEYKELNNYDVDVWLHEDASVIKFFGADCIVTSPTYGNRMADSHNAKDSSKRITYTHQIGRKLTEGNTGKMQWGDKYRTKHIDCYNNFYNICQKNLPTFMKNYRNDTPECQNYLHHFDYHFLVLH